MAKRKTVTGTAYQSAYMAARSGAATTDPLPDNAAVKKARRLPRELVKWSFWIMPDRLDRARNAVDALSGPPLRLTFTAMMASALDAEIARLSKKYNQGKPFPPRRGDLRPGSRPK